MPELSREVPAEATRLARERIIELVQMVPDKPLFMALHEDTVALGLQAALPVLTAECEARVEQLEEERENWRNSSLETEADLKHVEGVRRGLQKRAEEAEAQAELERRKFDVAQENAEQFEGHLGQIREACSREVENLEGAIQDHEAQGEAAPHARGKLQAIEEIQAFIASLDSTQPVPEQRDCGGVEAATEVLAQELWRHRGHSKPWNSAEHRPARDSIRDEARRILTEELLPYLSTQPSSPPTPEGGDAR